jgi:hypothetical protein
VDVVSWQEKSLFGGPSGWSTICGCIEDVLGVHLWIGSFSSVFCVQCFGGDVGVMWGCFDMIFRKFSHCLDDALRRILCDNSLRDNGGAEGVWICFGKS